MRDRRHDPKTETALAAANVSVCNYEPTFGNVAISANPIKVAKETNVRFHDSWLIDATTNSGARCQGPLRWARLIAFAGS